MPLPRPGGQFEKAFYGARYYANWLLFQGRNLERTVELVESNFPRLPAGYRERAISEALTAREEVSPTLSANPRNWERTPMRRLIGDDAAPKNWDLPNMWRYVVIFEAFNPAGGPSGFRTFVIDSATRLRRGELEQEALAVFNLGITHWQTGYGEGAERAIPFAAEDFGRIHDVRSVEKDP